MRRRQRQEACVTRALNLRGTARTARTGNGSGGGSHLGEVVFEILVVKVFFLVCELVGSCNCYYKQSMYKCRAKTSLLSFY